MRGRPVGLETLIFSHFYCPLVPSPLEGEGQGGGSEYSSLTQDTRSAQMEHRPRPRQHFHRLERKN